MQSGHFSFVTYCTDRAHLGSLSENSLMGDQWSGIDQALSLVGSIGFIVALVIVAVQYRRRLREIRRLTEANGLLARQLVAALARLDVYETVQPDRQPGERFPGRSGWLADPPGSGGRHGS